jgi:hypothetical protein
MSNTTTYKSLKQEIHGPIETLFSDVWIVKGGSKMPLPIPVRITKTMTIVRNPENQELTLINAMRVSDSLLTEIERLGTVKNVITIGGGHGKDDGFYRDRFGATVYDIEGHQYVRQLGPKSDKNEVYMEANVHLNKETQLPLPNAELKIIQTNDTPEGVLVLSMEGGILVTGDSLQNTAGPNEYTNFLAKIIMKKKGFFHSYNVGPAWLEKVMPNATDMKSIFLDSEYENVIPGHGDPVVKGAKEKYRKAVESAITFVE